MPVVFGSLWDILGRMATFIAKFNLFVLYFDRLYFTYTEYHYLKFQKSYKWPSLLFTINSNNFLVSNLSYANNIQSSHNIRHPCLRTSLQFSSYQISSFPFSQNSILDPVDTIAVEAGILAFQFCNLHFSFCLAIYEIRCYEVIYTVLIKSLLSYNEC